MVDFLFRIKDIHPFIEIKDHEEKYLFDLILIFMLEFSYYPSDLLYNEYLNSKLTKKINTLPSLEYLNKRNRYRELTQIEYNRLSSRFNSKPPFVFFFDLSIQPEEFKDDYGSFKIGYFRKGTWVS